MIPLAIAGAEMIGSVGPDLANCCAAIRAGLIRSEAISHFSVLDEESQELTPLIGRPIQGFTEGFFVQGLWFRVGLACFQGLVRKESLPNGADRRFWSATGLLAVTPPITDSRFECDASYTTQELKEAYLGRLIEFDTVPISLENADVICIGHAGAIAAVEHAGMMITKMGLERVIILAVDSYLDSMTLDWLDVLGRLKTAENPVGLIPGEAGACFMVESLAHYQVRSRTAHVVIQNAALDCEKDHYFSEKKTQGVALAKVISRSLSESAVQTPFRGDVISDLNGEEWRAYELGCARVRVAGQLDPEARFMFPAASLGEVGCASGAVAICFAMRALERGYARQDKVLVISTGDYGQVGAVLVSKYDGFSHNK